jgi:hypothetical protein
LARECRSLLFRLERPLCRQRLCLKSNRLCRSRQCLLCRHQLFRELHLSKQRLEPLLRSQFLPPNLLPRQLFQSCPLSTRHLELQSELPYQLLSSLLLCQLPLCRRALCKRREQQQLREQEVRS